MINHVCIIMDGNGRWANQHGMPRNEGHRKGTDSVRDVVESAAREHISYLSLFAFSMENWGRPTTETAALMALMVEAIHNETPTLLKNNIHCRFIGDRTMMPESVLGQMDVCERKTAACTGMTLLIAVSYSGKWDIVQAANRFMTEHPGMPLTDSDIESYLATAGIPDPDLLIRTGGEQRISNFMLWQLAYTELYFTPVLWPDFRRVDFEAALEAFGNRKRRFGKIL